MKEFGSHGVFVIVAHEDSLKGMILPSSRLIGPYKKGDTIRFLLKKGESYYCGTHDSDMTGTRLFISNNKNYSVYNGVLLSCRELLWKKSRNIPFTPFNCFKDFQYYSPKYYNSLWPDQCDGYRYIVPYAITPIDSIPGAHEYKTIYDKGYSAVRVVALFPNTKVKIAGRSYFMKNAGDQAGDSIRSSAYIEADKPVKMMHYPGGIRGWGTYMIPACNIDAVRSDTFDLPCAWQYKKWNLYRPWKTGVAWVLAPGPGNPQVWVNGRTKTLKQRVRGMKEEWYFDTVNIIDNYNNRLYCARGATGLWAYEFMEGNVQNIFTFGTDNAPMWAKLKVNGEWNTRFSAIAEVCAKTPVKLEAVLDWYKPAYVKWQLPGGKTDSGSAVQFSFKDTGLQQITFYTESSDTDCEGKTRRDTLTRWVHVYSIPALWVQKEAAMCQGQPVWIKANYTEKQRPDWWFEDSIYCRGCDSFLIPHGGDYSIRLQKDGCTQQEAIVQVTQSDTLKLKIVGDTVACYGQLINFRTSPIIPANKCHWSTGSKDSVIALVAVKSGWINAQVWDSCAGTWRRDSLYLQVHPALEYAGTRDTAICTGSRFRAREIASGGKPGTMYSYLWQNGLPDLSLSRDTQFMMILQDGCSKPDTAVIRVKMAQPLQILSAGIPVPLCEMQAKEWTPKASGGDTNRYNWYLKQGNRLLDSSFGSTGKMKPLAKKGKPITLSLRNACGNKDTTLNPVWADGPVMILPKADTLCLSGDSIHGSVLSSGRAKVFMQFGTQWDSAEVPGPFAISCTPGVVPMSAFVWADDGCALPDTQQVIVSGATAVSINLALVPRSCAPAEITPAWSAAGGRVGRYKMKVGADGYLPKPPLWKYTGDSSHLLFIQLSDGCSEARDTVKILLEPSAVPIPVWKDTQVCSPWEWSFVTPVARQPLRWEWNSGDGAVLKTALVAPGMSIPIHHKYKLTGTWQARLSSFWDGDSLKCVQSIRNITVVPAPLAAFSWTPENTDVTRPDVFLQNHSEYANKYMWYFGNGKSSTIPEPVITLQDSGEYTIVLIAKNQLGCADTASKQLRIWGNIKIWSPNTIVPSGVNTRFIPVVVNGRLEAFRVYNRWGERVYEGREPWFPSEHILPGVYAWEADVYTVLGQKIPARGTVMVVR
ncbi:MAG: hypothetical protein JNL57_05285 [Bacteroidetes bacterium]|nr:hypothetical protein [Bacteroidota bacterium]